MGVPRLEMADGGISPPSTKNIMFKVGKFKVTKPMFYIGGIVIVLLLIVYVKSKNNTVRSADMFYPNGTESIDNDVAIEAKLQNFENMMGTTLDGALTQMGNNMNSMMNDMRKENELMASELRQEQSSIASQIANSNNQMMNSLQQLLSQQLYSLRNNNQTVHNSYQPYADNRQSYQSSPEYYSSPGATSNSPYEIYWDYTNPNPQLTGNYVSMSGDDRINYEQNMNLYLGEVNNTYQDLITQGIVSNNWDTYHMFQAHQ